jgi:hypothetical protein
MDKYGDDAAKEVIPTVEEVSNSEEDTMAESRVPEDSQYFCVIVIPTYGDVDIRKYANHSEGMKELYDMHKLKEMGQFVGDIISFIGDFVKVTNMISTMQIHDPIRGKLELRNDPDFGEPKV